MTETKNSKSGRGAKNLKYAVSQEQIMRNVDLNDLLNEHSLFSEAKEDQNLSIDPQSSQKVD